MIPLFQQLAGAALAGMVSIPAGSYRPLHPAPGQPHVAVAAFRIDRRAVSRADFLAFVARNPAWRRTRVDAARSDSTYLAPWIDDLTPDAPARLAAPITDVSWFAADAYCRARGSRLPTTDEWEYVASASETRRDATEDPTFIRQLIALYSAPGAKAAFKNAYGVSGLHGVVWEWTADDGHPARETAEHGTAHIHEVKSTCAGAAIGATNVTNYPAFLREAVRASLTPRSSARHLGFRCASE